MGEFRKYRPYYAINALRFTGASYDNSSSNNTANNGKTRVPNFKDISGVEYGWLKNLAAYSIYNPNSSRTMTVSGIPSVYVRQGEWIGNQYQPFLSLNPFATNDQISQYSIDDYEINKIGRVDFTRAYFVAEDVNKVLYSMSIFNDNQDEYILNDSLIWDDEKTYYSLIEGEYIPLSEQPIDWNETYNTYYILKLAEDITVSCIKFRIPMIADSDSSRAYNIVRARESANSNISSNNYSGIVPIFGLLCAYFLDEPVTIHPGDSHLLSLSFESSQF